jgi:hypothetical protein
MATNKLVRLLTALLLTAGSMHPAQAQLMSWQFGDTASLGSEASYAATYRNPAVIALPLTRGAGLNASGFVRGFSATSFTLNGTKDSAIAYGDYYQMGLTVGAGANVSLYNIDARLRRSSVAAANAYRWMYSLNGTTFTPIDTADVPFTTATADGDNQVQVLLAGIPALQRLAPGTAVTLRLYLWGATTATSTIAIGRQVTGSAAPSLAVGGRVTPVDARALLGFQFGNPASNGDELSYGSTTNDSGVAPSVLTRGPGADSAASTLPRGFVASNFSLNGTKINALTNGDYFQFVVAPVTGDTVSLSTLDCRLRKSGAGPNTYRWMYSTDSINFIELGASDVSFVSTSDGVDQPQIDLSAIGALQNLTAGKTVTFRLFAWGATTATGTFAIGRYIAGSGLNSLEIQGKSTKTIVPPPPPPPATTSVKGASKEGAIIVYPNPAMNSCVVSLPQTADEAFVTLMDLQGRIIRQIQVAAGTSSTVVSLEGLASGSYLLKYRSGSAQSATLLQKQ